jgi:hypothetical protein
MWALLLIVAVPVALVVWGAIYDTRNRRRGHAGQFDPEAAHKAVYDGFTRDGGYGAKHNPPSG